MFTLYSADFIGNPGNCSYPHKTVVMDTDSFKAAVGHDYVCAEYKHHYRNGENFLSADCLPVDCDNDHSEDPKDWITPADVLEAFPGVSLAIHYSRFNQREKNGKPARPKFHVLFPIERVTDATLYSDMKKLVNSIFPYFDTNALDAARFFFGTQEPNVELYPGRMNLTEFLNDDEFDAGLPGGHEKDATIPEGSRNATMSRFAGIVIKKYGDTEKAYQSFLEKAATCVPPLDNNELTTIWHSAQRFYSKISREDGYVPPDVYNDEKAALMQQADITIINRENLQWLIDESGFPFDFDMVIIDELSSFKNHKSKRFKSLMKVRPKLHRIIGLTGTPSSNGLMDLWAEFKVLDMGERLGRFITQYRTNYFMPDKRNGEIIYSYKPLPYAEDAIYRKISDITISMKSTDHLKMPELVSTEYEVQLSDSERSRYEDLKQELILQLPDGEVTAANAASLTGKLSQLANGAIYADTGEVIEFHDRKLDALEDFIEASNEKPLLVAYWFRHDLSRIKNRFNVREIKTSRDIADWNAGKIPVAVIHPASAGHGLNLQAGGSTLVWFGLTWSLELYQQTNARLWRQGQESRTVVIQHIITKGTIDERIVKALSKKEMTQSTLIDAVKADLEVV